MRQKILPIVEGESEVGGIPVILRRLLLRLERPEALVDTPFRSVAPLSRDCSPSWNAFWPRPSDPPLITARRQRPSSCSLRDRQGAWAVGKAPGSIGLFAFRFRQSLSSGVS